MPTVYTFAAYSNTGKTTYIEKLIPCLKARGLRVGVIKHDAHEVQLDMAGKDTWRFTEAGADAVAIGSGRRFVYWEQHSAPLSELLRHFSDMDIILTEGYKQEGYPKIALFRKDSGNDLAIAPADCWAIVTDTPIEAVCPLFPLDDPEVLAEHLYRVSQNQNI